MQLHEDRITVSSPEEWREWLASNHDRGEGVWLTIRKKGAEAQGVSYREALEEALCFGWIDGQAKGGDEFTYTIRFTSRKSRSPWSKINKTTAERLIEEGRMAAPGLAKIEEAKRNGEWEAAYTSRGPVAIPDDLAAALTKTPSAAANFEAFSTSVKNNYVTWIDKAKRPETRQRRIASVVERSEKNLKPVWMAPDQRNAGAGDD